MKKQRPLLHVPGAAYARAISPSQSAGGASSQETPKHGSVERHALSKQNPPGIAAQSVVAGL